MTPIDEVILNEVQKYIKSRWEVQPNTLFVSGITLTYLLRSEDDKCIGGFLEYDSIYYYVFLDKATMVMTIKEMFLTNSNFKYIDGKYQIVDDRGIFLTKEINLPDKEEF